MGKTKTPGAGSSRGLFFGYAAFGKKSVAKDAPALVDEGRWGGYLCGLRAEGLGAGVLGGIGLFKRFGMDR